MKPVLFTFLLAALALGQGQRVVGPVTIEGDLAPDTDALRTLGGSTLRYNTVESLTFISRNSSGGTARCLLSIGGFSCVNASGVTDTNIAANGTLKFVGLSGSGVRCLQTDNAGLVTAFTTGCAGGANVSLSNLSSTAVNDDINPDTDALRALGGSTLRYNTIESLTFISRNSSGSTARCYQSSGGFSCVNAGGVADTNIAANGTLKFVGLSGSGTRCLQADNNGTVTVFTAGCGGANTSLSNLVSTAVNADINPDTDALRQLGGSTLRYNTIESLTFISRSSSGSTARCFLSSGGFSCTNAGGVTDTTVAANGTLKFVGLSGSGTRCLQADNNGNVSVFSAGCAAAGANVSLSNLSSVAINADLNPGADAARVIGTSTLRYNTIESLTFISRSSSGSTARCFFSSGGFSCVNSGGVTDTNIAANGTLKFVGLSGSGTRCVQTDNNGTVTVFSTGCVPTSRNVSTSFPLTGGGSLAGDLTLACSGCVSTSSVSSLGGNYTITGNFYNRSFAGNGIGCGGVSDGWTAVDSSGKSILMCLGGSRYKVDLTAY